MSNPLIKDSQKFVSKGIYHVVFFKAKVQDIHYNFITAMILFNIICVTGTSHILQKGYNYLPNVNRNSNPPVGKLRTEIFPP